MHELRRLLDFVILQLIKTKLGSAAVLLAITHGSYQGTVIGVDAHVQGVSVSHQVIPHDQAIGCVICLGFQAATVCRYLNIIEILVCAQLRFRVLLYA